ncbi:MAG: hypothetical protein IKN98_00810 [Bacteroidales bacterium]|nr:hypothetical protein [Bacteroidales bacterium]
MICRDNVWRPPAPLTVCDGTGGCGKGGGVYKSSMAALRTFSELALS